MLKVIKNFTNGIKKATFILLLFINASCFSQSNGFEQIKGLELMDLIYQQLDMHYVDEPKPGKLSKIAIDAMLKDLDPYTVYYHEANMEDCEAYMQEDDQFLASFDWRYVQQLEQENTGFHMQISQLQSALFAEQTRVQTLFETLKIVSQEKTSS